VTQLRKRENDVFVQEKQSKKIETAGLNDRETQSSSSNA
jgi:hypothetical protein